MHCFKPRSLVPRRFFQLRASYPEISQERSFRLSKQREAVTQRNELKQFKEATAALDMSSLARRKEAAAVMSRKESQFHRYLEQCQAPLAKRLPLVTNTVLDLIKSACRSSHFTLIDRLLQMLKIQNRMYHRRISQTLFRVLIQNGRLDDLLKFLLERGKYGLFCNTALLNHFLEALAHHAGELREELMHHVMQAKRQEKRVGRLLSRQIAPSVRHDGAPIDAALLAQYKVSFEKCLLSALQAMHLFGDYMVRMNETSLALVQSILSSYVGPQEKGLIEQAQMAIELELEQRHTASSTTSPPS